MPRPALLALAAIVLASASHAQVLQNTSGQNTALAEDYLANFDAGINITYSSHQYLEIQNPLGTDAFASNGAWSSQDLAGAASGNGEAASAHGSLTQTATSATYTAFESGTGDFASNITDTGPYYGVKAGSGGTGESTFEFSPTGATSISLVGEVTGQGAGPRLRVTLFDLTQAGPDYEFDSIVAGTFEINFSEQLVAGDFYELFTSANGSGYVYYDGTGKYANVQGASGSTAYLNATFTSAPEPVSCGLLGLGAAALARRRSRSIRPADKLTN